MSRRPAVLATLAALFVAAPAAAVQPPRMSAAAYMVVDPATGEVLAQRAPHRELPMASTTKIMTALIVLERTKLDHRYVVPAEATRVGGSSGRLIAGERLSVRDLLRALLVASGNDAAVTLADGVAGGQPAFVALMNARARRLGLHDTHFANPHGLDAPGHHTSAADLVRLARVAMRHPVFRQLVSHRRDSIPGPRGRGRRPLLSENELLDIDREADGIKTGMTNDAGYALVAHARRPSLGVELYLASIGSPSSSVRARQARALLNWGFAQYARASLLRPGQEVARAQIEGSAGRSIPLRPASPLTATLRLGVPVTERLVAPAQVRAPVSAGQVLGTVTFLQGDHRLGRRDLVAGDAADRPGLLERLRAGLQALVP